MFDKRLKQLRNEANLTQKQLANAVDTSQQNIAFYEQNKRQPKQDILERISKYFNVSTDYLMGKTDKRKTDLTKTEFLFRSAVEDLDLTEEQQEIFKQEINDFIEQRRKALRKS
ncbi:MULTISPECIES: helix-turn-helix domain-containing protein [Streptococcus]|uniref:helix-turn-helix domain-containing protein n=1 Tax=Streptococcus TaxID=1301 RepID=UPI0006202BE4|nr:helix-turn-helix transcriptional regulator [Streptococcus uberis]KKF45199.1 Cro/Cl family transcriptional regulator [Streptococcus uberis EF20/0145]